MENDITSQNTNIPAKPRIPFGWLRAIIFVIAAIVLRMVMEIVIFSSGMVAKEDLKTDSGPDPGGYMMVMIAMVASLMVLIWCMRKIFDRRSFKSLGFGMPKNSFDILFGLLIGVGLIAGVWAILYFSGSTSVMSGSISTKTLFLYFGLFLFAGFYEEIMIRSYMLNSLAQSMNKYIALVITAIPFMALHLGNNNVTIIGSVNIFLAGIFLGQYYIHRKNIWFPTALHLGWNFAQGPLFGFEVSGNQTESLMVQSLSGNELITGGKFGLEGSILVTILMVVIIGLTELRYRRDSFPLKE